MLSCQQMIEYARELRRVNCQKMIEYARELRRVSCQQMGEYARELRRVSCQQMGEYARELRRVSCQQMGEHARELRRVSVVKKMSSDDGNIINKYPTDLTLTGSEFQRVVAATKKAVVPVLISTLTTKSRLELNCQRCLDFFVGVSFLCTTRNFIFDIDR